MAELSEILDVAGTFVSVLGVSVEEGIAKAIADLAEPDERTDLTQRARAAYDAYPGAYSPAARLKSASYEEELRETPACPRCGATGCLVDGEPQCDEDE